MLEPRDPKNKQELTKGTGGDSIDKASGRRAHVKFEEMKRPVW